MTVVNSSRKSHNATLDIQLFIANAQYYNLFIKILHQYTITQN